MMFPQSRDEAGKSYWEVLFNIASQYPDHPTRDDKINTNNLIKSIISKFTCKECIEHAFDYMRNNPAKLDDKESLFKWTCSLKNNSNKNAGKPEIDCNDFTLNNLDRTGGCKECSIEPIKAPSISLKNNMPIPAAPKFQLPKIGSVLDYEQRYPSLRHAMTASASTTETVSGGPSMDLESKYPSLAITEEVSIEPKEEELDGVIKGLDGLYTLPASLVDIKPSDFNLAYTPEMVTNLTTLLTQMYMTNFGSLFTTVVSSFGLLGISIFAKGALSRYDRLFLQNIVGSMLFHALNFINPRIKEEVMTDIGKMYDGVTTMDFEKIKGAILYSDKNEKSNKELMSEMIDMEKLGKHGGQGFSGEVSTVKSSVPDLRILGSGGIGAPLSRGDIENRFNSTSQLRSPMDHPAGMRNVGKTHYGPNNSLLNDIDDKYGFILDNDLF